MIERISDRVSVDRSAGRTSVVIDARATPAKRALITAWTIAWVACGVAVLVERAQLAPGDPLRQYLLAFIAFWAYFLVMIGKALLWRWRGLELWRVKDGRFTIKDSILGYGRAHDYFVENIQALGLIKEDRASWKWQWNNSLWVVGGERLGFEHLGRKVVFGKGLGDEEARRLAAVLKDALKEARRLSAPKG
ncbi:MAG: hypothetical protein QY325_01840 [Flavobacteriales bacterium]|jgi:hypothetical protein|nr:MAG: hypothetical protein QY325_01840 [Flavobacteriales bacterium]